MKKVGYIILSIVVVIVSITLIDFIYMFNNDKPLFAVKKSDTQYSGLFYNTYVCPENSWLTIKGKFTKYSCVAEPIKLDEDTDDLTDSSLTIKSIQDETIGRTDLAFAQALELFYEDENYEYYFSCIKSSYVTVTYTNGTKETVKEALKKGNITMEDVDKYGIHYYKEHK